MYIYVYILYIQTYKNLNFLKLYSKYKNNKCKEYRTYTNELANKYNLSKTKSNVK